MIYAIIYLLGFCFTMGLCLATQTTQYINKNTGVVLAACIIWPIFLPTIAFAYLFGKMRSK